jgi:hypothetical protein
LQGLGLALLTREELLAIARSEPYESELLDFKCEYAPEKKAAFWAETIKDIVSFANSRGGAIVFGINDDGTVSANDCSMLMSLDTAALADQVRKYTDVTLHGLFICEAGRNGINFPTVIVEPVSVPLVFTKVGTYEVEPGKQKTAFSVGTIYVRHGTKSEPCVREDLKSWVDREVQRQREEWLGNIRKVVEAEPGASVIVLSPSSLTTPSPVRLTNDPTAPVARLQRLSDEYPLRQSDVIHAINKKLSGRASVNSHDIQTVKHCLGIDPEARPDLIHKPHDLASPQYTVAFIDVVVLEFEKSTDFFEKCRESWKAHRYGY